MCVCDISVGDAIDLSECENVLVMVYSHGQKFGEFSLYTSYSRRSHTFGLNTCQINVK